MKLQRYALLPLNLSGKLMVGSRTYGWEEDVLKPGSNGGCDSVDGGFLECRIATLLMIPEGFHSLVEVVARPPRLGLGCSSILVCDSLFTLIRIKVHLSICSRRYAMYAS